MMMNVKFRIKSLYKSFMRSIRYPKWWYQRARRGYSDRDMWNADNYLAGIFAGVLQWYVDKSMGVPTRYASEDDPNCEEIYDMAARRDADYAFYASIFAEYHIDGLAYNENWQKEFGGVLEKDIKDSMHWLADHFIELWD